MRKCSENCFAICDFCKFYLDNSVLNNNDEFEGIGVCKIDNSEVTASDYCYDNFHCFRAEND